MTASMWGVAILAAHVLALVSAGPLKPHGAGAPPQAPAVATPVAVTNSTKSNDEKAEVAMLRARLTKIGAGLTAMLSPEGALSKTKIAPTMQTFSTELQKVLKETESEKDTKKALKSLKDAQLSVQTLTKDITAQQVQLMRDGEKQEDSLLLGILMTHRTKPMAEQLEILADPEFAKLPVVVAILAANNTKTPLFEQVAAYLDKNDDGKPVATTDNSTSKKAVAPKTLAKSSNMKKPNVDGIVKLLEARLHSLEANEKQMTEHIHEEDKELEEESAKAQKNKALRVAHHLKVLQKSDDRKYAKQVAQAKHDVANLRDAIRAIKVGDMKALGKAQAAIQASLKEMEAQGNGFIVLIQMVHRATELDCPFCAAQCVDKCHSAGKPYVTCMTDCADAGK